MGVYFKPVLKVCKFKTMSGTAGDETPLNAIRLTNDSWTDAVGAHVSGTRNPLSTVVNLLW